MVLPRFELLECEAMGWELVRGTELQVGHGEGKRGAGIDGSAVTTLAMLPMVSGSGSQ